MVQVTRRQLVRLGASAALASLLPGIALASSGQQRVVDRARLTLETFIDDPAFEEMRVYVQNAYGVLIVPELLKAGLFLGVEHGIGVLLVRNVETGTFGPPAFFDLYGGSFGLQIGGQSSDVIFTIMNPGAIDRLMSSRFKLGADASVAAGRRGAGIGAGTTTRFGEDIYTFARSRGLYGGLSLDGSMVLVKEDWNEGYYSQRVSARGIVAADVDNPGSHALRQTLQRF